MARISEAIVLRTYPLKEADLIVSFLTRDQGKLRGVAKRARSPKGKFGASLERLALGKMSIFSERCGNGYALPLRLLQSGRTIFLSNAA
jgi:DNA repair protein RecO